MREARRAAIPSSRCLAMKSSPHLLQLAAVLCQLIDPCYSRGGGGRGGGGYHGGSSRSYSGASSSRGRGNWVPFYWHGGSHSSSSSYGNQDDDEDSTVNLWVVIMFLVIFVGIVAILLCLFKKSVSPRNFVRFQEKIAEQRQKVQACTVVSDRKPVSGAYIGKYVPDANAPPRYVSLVLSFVDSPPKGFEIRGTGRDRLGVTAIKEGFVNNAGDTYWVEEGEVRSGLKFTITRTILITGHFNLVENSFVGKYDVSNGIYGPISCSLVQPGHVTDTDNLAHIGPTPASEGMTHADMDRPNPTPLLVSTHHHEITDVAARNIGGTFSPATSANCPANTVINASHGTTDQKSDFESSNCQQKKDPSVDHFEYHLL